MKEKKSAYTKASMVEEGEEVVEVVEVVEVAVVGEEEEEGKLPSFLSLSTHLRQSWAVQFF